MHAYTHTHTHACTHARIHTHTHTHTHTELQALAEIIGPYGIRYMGEKLMEQVSGQVGQKCLADCPKVP